MGERFLLAFFAMDADRLVHNETLAMVRCVPMEDRHGRDVAVVIVKLTWAVSATGVATLADPQRGVRLHDVSPAGDRSASPRYPSDLVEEKPGTDVLLVGTAHPPRGAPCSKMEVALRIEPGGDPLGPKPLAKMLEVHGPRLWVQGSRRPVPGPAGTLTPTPLVYDLAFGGPDEPRNPVGTGAVSDTRSLIGQRAPAIEDPRAPIDSPNPAPAGFAPIPMHFSPRSERLGTHDASWYRERAPVRPRDFDPRHHSCAPPDQWSEVPLRGDEPIEVVGATPDGVWRFRLPRWAPLVTSSTRGLPVSHSTHLDTLLIDADQRCVELSWRVAVPLPRKTELLESVRIREASQPRPASERRASSA